jgi:arginyl-tRNA synthetase
MKSREGTVVDADDLMQEMRKRKIAEDLGKLDTYSAEEKQNYNTIGLGL